MAIHSLIYRCKGCKNQMWVVRKLGFWDYVNYRMPECTRCGSSDVITESDETPSQGVLDRIYLD